MARTDPVHAHLVWLGDNLASRGRNPDMVTINPADCLPHEVYEGTADGERWTMQRLDPNSRLAWAGFRHDPHFMDAHDHRWFPDDEVSSLVRLVPARPVTRNDLPTRRDLVPLMYETQPKKVVADLILNAVVERLNEHGEVPVPYSAELANAFHRADTAERERDEAASRLAGVRDAHQRSADAHMKWKARAEAAERERDEWRAKAETAEADPVVYAIRESDIAAVNVVTGDHGEWVANGNPFYFDGLPNAREWAEKYANKAIQSIAIARAIEAGQDTDPVEDAAVAAFKKAWHEADAEGDAGNRTVRGIRAARHVLGQEAGDA